MLAVALLVAGCVAGPPDSAKTGAGAVEAVAEVPPPPPLPTTASAAGIRRAEPVGDLPQGMAARALAAFRLSCPTLLRRADTSGLTAADDWRAPCAAAATMASADADRFFRTALVPVTVGEGRALATGYYEPEIAASPVRAPGYDAPLYRRPPDLIEADLGAFAPDLTGRRVRGRLEGAMLVPYHDRRAIDGGALAGRGLELAWAADPVELFFLQVQGSGRLRMPDGRVMRVGYDGQNGHAYTGIGRLLLDRKALAPGQASMDGIMAYLRADPVRGRAVMHENKSWVFFRELTGARADEGPTGALGLPVTPRVSVAADPRFVPLGAPVLLDLDRDEADGLWIAQDTGGAIKGANRVDTFWGAGPEARAIAGGMMGRGTMRLLLPPAAVERLEAARTAPAAPPAPVTP